MTKQLYSYLNLLQLDQSPTEANWCFNILSVNIISPQTEFQLIFGKQQSRRRNKLKSFWTFGSEKQSGDTVHLRE